MSAAIATFSGRARLSPWPAAGTRFRRLLAVVLLAASVVVGWTFLAPPQLGGSTSYVVTSGISMLPHFRKGDLVVLRREPDYHVGEVAGYHSDLGVVVMHRIIAERDGHYVFKGDNNNFIDTYHPTKAQIVGAEWLHVAGAGRFLAGLRSPMAAAALLGALCLFCFAPGRRTRRQRRRHRHAR